MTRDRVRLTATTRDPDDYRPEVLVPTSITRLDRSVARKLDLEVDCGLSTKRHALPAKDHVIDVWLDNVNVICSVAVSAQVGPHAGDHCETLEIRLACDREIEWPEVRIRY